MEQNERIMVFIDGSNFYHGMKSLANSIFDVNQINFYKLGKVLAKERKIVRIYYYNAPLDQTKDPQRYAKQRRFFEKVRNTPEVSLVLCRMQKRIFEGRETYAVKGDDIHIAVDMVKFAYNDAYDTAILVSGDGDFVPAVKAVQEKGKRVEHAYFKIGHSYHLRQTCNSSILLDSDLIKNSLDTES